MAGRKHTQRARPARAEPTLFDGVGGRRASIQERFECFCAEHPDVYALFERFARELLASGVRRYGARSLVERIRWHYATSSGGQGEPKINDNFISRFARKLIGECPEFAGFFETRKLKA